MYRSNSTRAAMMLASVLTVLLLIPAAASASHFSGTGTNSNCDLVPSTSCTINVHNNNGYSNGQIVSIALDAGYTYAEAPRVATNGCTVGLAPSLTNSTTVHVAVSGNSGTCSFSLVAKMSYAVAPFVFPCQTVDLTDGTNFPVARTCAVLDVFDPVAPTISSTPTSPNNDTSPFIHGFAEPYSAVKLYATANCTGPVVGSGDDLAYASPGFQVSAPVDTNNMFSATTTDVAGNVSACSAALRYVDATPPAVPTVDAITPSGPSSATSVTITGTAEAGSTVKLYTTAGCTGTPVATGTSGAYTTPGLTFTVLGADGTRTYRATATDPVGNTSACSSTSVGYVLDTTAPTLPVITFSSPLSPADASSPEFGGTAEAGSTVRLYRSATCSGAVVASGGAASFAGEGLTVIVPPDSVSLITATSTDVAGNTSLCSIAFAYTEDSTAPAAPTLLAFAPSSPSNSNTPRVTGTAEAASTVRLYATADCSGPAEAVGSAAAFASPGLLVSVASDQTTTFRATTTDVAGHTSACSAGLGYVEDSTAPGVPVILATDPLSPANANTVVVSGGAAAASTVRVYLTADCSGPSQGSDTAAAFAAPGISVSVADDSTNALRATATDAAGNTSACSAAVAYVEDSTAPAAVVIGGSSPASPANDNTPRITGSAQAGSTVSVYSTSDCTGTVEGSGSAAGFASPGVLVSAPGDAATTFYATAQDVAGNTSACSTGFSYTEDSTAPVAPTLLATTPASPSSDNNPRVTGGAEAGSTVRVYATADCSGPAEVSGSDAAFGAGGLLVTVGSDQTTTLHATATDAAGNTSACSASSIAYQEISTGPAPPTFTATTPASPSSDNTVRVKGTADTGTTVRLYTSPDCSGTSVASGTAGAFTATGLSVTVAADSVTTFSASSTDAASNVTCSATTVRYVEDSTAPAAPAIAGLNPASPANANTVKVTGTAEVGGTVRLYKGADCTGAVVGTAATAAFADPGITVTVADDTSTSLRATTTDAAGNVSACSGAAGYVEDSTAPPAPALGSLSPASPANENHPSILGSAEAGTTVALYGDASCAGAVLSTVGAATLAATGVEVTVPDDSQTAFAAVAIDAAGNHSPCSAPVRYVERTTPPALPAPPAREGIAPTSTIAKITRAERRSRMLTLHGTADGTGSAVQSVRVSVARVSGTRCRFLVEDGTFTAVRSCARTTYMPAKGRDAWSLTLHKLPKGSYKVRSRAIDAAGNTERKVAGRNLLRFRL